MSIAYICLTALVILGLLQVFGVIVLPAGLLGGLFLIGLAFLALKVVILAVTAR